MLHHVCRRKPWKSSSLHKVDIVSRKFSEKHNMTMYCSTISLVSITITFDCKITTQKPTLTLMKMSFRCFYFQNVFVAEIFFLFNVLLSTIDVATDLFTVLTLFPDHPRWASIVLTWMFTSFFVHAGIFVLKRATGKGEKKYHIRGSCS